MNDADEIEHYQIPEGLHQTITVSKNELRIGMFG
jgi:hypothetical protein